MHCSATEVAELGARRQRWRSGELRRPRTCRRRCVRSGAMGLAADVPVPETHRAGGGIYCSQLFFVESPVPVNSLPFQAFFLSIRSVSRKGRVVRTFR